MSIHQAMVKSVLSGDTVILTSTKNPRQERTFCLAFVNAPRLRREGDEPHAFESRDFLRKLLVGKVVQFQVLYNIPLSSSGQLRDYGTLVLQSGQTLPRLAVAEGWLKLRDDPGKNAESDTAKTLLEKLRTEEAEAKAASKGVWAGKEEGKLETKYELSDPKAFADEWRGKPIDGIVERVLTGDRLILRLKVKPDQHVQTMVLVAGIRAPSTKRTNPSDGKEQEAEDFGEEAHFFVEQRLLQRGISVNILGVSPQGQLVASVMHPNGSIAEFILREGLARCVDHHSVMLGGEMAKLRDAEKLAKSKKRGLFQGHVPTKASGGDSDVTVTRVQTADTIYVRSKTGPEKRVNLSSIRQPKPGDPKQAPFQAEAKEFLRKRLIGKHIKMTIDGKKAASEGYEEREVATFVQNSKNVALQLVESGYASVIRHRRDDDDRSPQYDELLAAEEAAQKEKKGMWSEKPPASKAMVDYSESLQKAKVQASVMQRQKKVPGIVDFVKGGSRFTVLIPRENAKLTFVLSCIRAPRSARSPSDPSEPFGQEAHDFANRKCMQRDVEIDVEGTDKVGGFIGTLFVNRENFAKLLLEEGLATVHAYSAEQSAHGPELFAAEKKAKEARKGLWHDYDPSAEEGEEDQDASAPATNGTAATNGASTPSQARKLDYRETVITHVDPLTLRLKFQLIGTGTGALEEMMSKFRSFHLSAANKAPLPNPPKAGDFVAARFSEDGSWYRARVRRNDREAKTSEVVYVDYGNEEKLPWAELRTLAPQFDTKTLKPQAQEAVLAFLQWPTAKEYIADAYAYLNENVNGREMVASVEYTDTKDNGVLHVVLFSKDLDRGVTESVNADVVGEGLAVVKRSLKGWEKGAEGGEVLKGLREREAKAKEERVGGWEYGEFGDDEVVDKLR
ncbi:hypothetical protein MMC13_002670 [Lambiella insularis]|nr:hypothetical protein [Lambiella insularis]